MRDDAALTHIPIRILKQVRTAGFGAAVKEINGVEYRVPVWDGPPLRARWREEDEPHDVIVRDRDGWEWLVWIEADGEIWKTIPRRW